MKSLIASIMVLGLVGTAVGVAVQGADITATVTPGVISVTVDSATAPYGVMPLGATKDSAVITATNGDVPADLGIIGSDATGPTPTWALASAPGTEEYTHAYTTKDNPYPATGETLAADATLGWKDLTTGYQTLATVAGNGTQAFKLDMRTPITSTGVGEYTTTVTVQATFAN